MSRVAVKTIPHDTNDEGLQHYIVREIAKIVKLSLHPNICELVKVSIASEGVSLYLKSCTIGLGSYIKCNNDRMVYYSRCFRHLAQALMHAHRYGVEHCYLDVNNIYLDSIISSGPMFMIGSFCRADEDNCSYSCPEELLGILDNTTCVHGVVKPTPTSVWSLAVVMTSYALGHRMFPNSSRDDVINRICELSSIEFDTIESLAGYMRKSIDIQATAQAITSSRWYIPIISLKRCGSRINVASLLDTVSRKLVTEGFTSLLESMLSFMPFHRPSIADVCDEVAYGCFVHAARNVRSMLPVPRRSILPSQEVSAEFVNKLCSTLNVPDRILHRAIELYFMVATEEMPTLPTMLACLLLVSKASTDDDRSCLSLKDLCEYVSSLSMEDDEETADDTIVSDVTEITTDVAELRRAIIACETKIVSEHYRDLGSVVEL